MTHKWLRSFFFSSDTQKVDEQHWGSLSRHHLYQSVNEYQQIVFAQYFCMHTEIRNNINFIIWQNKNESLFFRLLCPEKVRVKMRKEEAAVGTMETTGCCVAFVFFYYSEIEFSDNESSGEHSISLSLFLSIIISCGLNHTLACLIFHWKLLVEDIEIWTSTKKFFKRQPECVCVCKRSRRESRGANTRQQREQSTTHTKCDALHFVWHSENFEWQQRKLVFRRWFTLIRLCLFTLPQANAGKYFCVSAVWS